MNKSFPGSRSPSGMLIAQSVYRGTGRGSKMKIDLHVHTIHSNRPAEFMLSAVKTGECYTTPKDAYDACLRRGMDMVTITDHDTIAGALEITHLPHSFTSEEITASFPDEDVQTHIVALDITEAQHAEIGKVRKNIFELVEYLRKEDIAHYLAHPMSAVHGPLRPEHIQKFLLMFKHFEGKNGTRDEKNGLAFMRILDSMTYRHLVTWANIYDIEPVDWSTDRYLTGGSDDHGWLNIARAYTVFNTEEKSTRAMKTAFQAGEIEMGGSWGNASVLSHNIYSVTFQYFQRHSSSSAFGDILDLAEVEQVRKSKPESNSQTRKKEIEKTIEEAMDEGPEIDIENIRSRCHMDEFQENVGITGRRIINRLFKKFLGDMIDATSEIDIDRAFDRIPGILSTCLLLLPYLFGYRFIVKDRITAEKLASDMGLPGPDSGKIRVAMFTDTGFEVNGVAIGLKRMVASLRSAGHEAELAVCSTPPEDKQLEDLREKGGLFSFEPVGEFNLPVYSEMKMGFPSLIDVMEYLCDRNIDVVQLSTPGPLCLTTLLAARLMGISVVANYHTEIPKYAQELTNDLTITSIMSSFTGWFYRQADQVIVPSKSARESVCSMGVPAEIISILPRGVNTSLFNVGKKTETCLCNHAAENSRKILYVGRISREKGLDVLLGAFKEVNGQCPDTELFVVGDGPYREELEKKNTNPNVHFPGYRRGEELARIYASSDIFAFPSATDTFGNVVLEAMSSGLPVIVVNQGGAHEQVFNGLNGYTVNAGAAEEMAGRILALLKDEGLRARMSLAARQHASSRSMKKSAEAHWKLYVEMSGKKLPEPSPSDFLPSITPDDCRMFA